MNKRTIVLFTIILLLFLFLGICIIQLFFKSDDRNNENIIVDNKKELRIIDSLQNTNDSLMLSINDYKKLNEELKDSIEVKIIYIEKRIEAIKKMSVNENTELLKDNLVVYGELSSVTDTFPCIISSDEKDDSIVALSKNNLKDINCIIAKYEYELGINNYLNQTIKNDSVIISLKDDIISNKDEAFNREKRIFEQNMKSMQEQIDRERRNKNLAIGGGIAATISVGILTYLITK